MPRFYKRKRTTFTKRLRSRRRTNAPRRGRRRLTHTATINRALTPYAQRYITKLKYCESYTATATILHTQRWRLNSLFDPNYSLGGHQPYGFDQLATVYNRYRVVACSWTIHVASSTNYVTVCAIPNNDLPSPLNMSAAKELPRAKWSTGGGGTNIIRITGKTYIPSLVGRTKAQYMADDRYQALTSADPQEAAILQIMIADCNDTTSLSGVQVSVTLNYLAEFFDINTLSQS